MMLYLLLPALFGCGLYLFLNARLHLPSARTVRALASLEGEKKPLSEALAYPLANRLAHVLPMGDYRKRQIEKQLSIAGMDMSPQYYVSSAVVMGLLAAVPAILLFIFSAALHDIIFALFGIVFLAVAVLIIWLELHRTGKRAQQLRDELEAEFPKLTAAVRQGIESTPDVYYVLDRYRRNVAGKAMCKELDVLLADMATGDREIAFSHFESRCASEHASALVRALIGIDRGEDMQTYLDGLDVQLREWELNQLKKEAAKRPDELRPASLALLGAMLILYAILFSTVIWNSVQVFFQM